jgi:hypothetical protein
MCSRDNLGLCVHVTAVLLLSGGIFAWSSRTIRHEPAWRTFEFCQYAEIGANLARGRGMVTGLAEPMALSFIDRHQRSERGERWPVINRFPLPCVIVAGLMAVAGVSDQTAAWSNGLALGLLAAVTSGVAYRWYGRSWGAIAAVLWLANPSFYGYFPLLGTPDIWFALILFVQLLLWARPKADARPRVGWAALVGATAGLAYLTRFNMVMFVAVQLGVLAWQRRWRESLVVLGAGLAVVSPYLAYNLYHFGRPTADIYSAWNLLDRIGVYPLEPWLYYDQPDVLDELSQHVLEFLAKLANNLFRVVPVRLWTLWHFYLLMPLAGLALWLMRGASPDTGCLRWSVAFMAMQLVLFSGLRLEFEHRLSPHHGRYFFWFAAPALLLSIAALRVLGERHGRFRSVVALVVVSQLAFYAVTWRDWIVQNRAPIYLGRDPIRAMLAQTIPPNAVVASNQPQLLAWYCGLKAISLPANLAELHEINRLSPTPVEYIFVDVNFSAIEMDDRWAMLVQPHPAVGSPWEAELMGEYQYARDPRETRPFLFVLLRRATRHGP